MIIIKIIGGLGNQLSQYAFGWRCAELVNTVLKLDITSYENYDLHNYSLNKLCIGAEIATKNEIDSAKECILVEKKIRFDYQLMNAIEDGIYIEGYFSDSRYFMPVYQNIISEFKVKKKLTVESEFFLKMIHEVKGNSVSIHFRRGDYVINENCYNLPMEYYSNSINIIKEKVDNPVFFIFSDDISWVKDNLNYKENVIYVTGVGDNVEDLYLMSNCHHNIVANSSFSYWGAMLNNKESKLVIYPETYFKKNDKYLLSLYGEVIQPYYPDEWEKCFFERNSIFLVGVWNYYEELNDNGYMFFNSDAGIGDNLLKPINELYLQGIKENIEFKSLSELNDYDEVDLFLFMDFPNKNNSLVRESLDSSKPKFLIISETEVIKGDNWMSENHSIFNKIFTWNDDYVDFNKYIKLNFPQNLILNNNSKNRFEKRKFCTLISSFKGSNHMNELYSLRVSVIRWFEENQPRMFDLYGKGWNQNEFPSYLGVIDKKSDMLSSYKFSICFENASGYSGYITEKIFDCFMAGCVPIYYGASNIEDHIPSECFIDFRKFSDLDEMYIFMALITENEYSNYMEAIDLFINRNSPNYSNEQYVYVFSIHNYTRTLIHNIKRYILNDREISPKISIVIPTYNQVGYIEKAINSVLTQGVDDFEIIIVNNASTDSTLEVLEKYKNNSKIRIYNNKLNYGSLTNHLIAYEASYGEYYAVLHSDDYYSEGHLLEFIDKLDEEPTSILAYSPCYWVNESNNVIKVANHVGHRNNIPFGCRNEVVDLLVNDCYITPSAALIRRRFYDRIFVVEKGGVKNRCLRSLYGATDWFSWINLAYHGYSFIFIEKPSVYYRIHEGQHSREFYSDIQPLLDHISIIEAVLTFPKIENVIGTSGPDIYNHLLIRLNTYPTNNTSHLMPKINEIKHELFSLVSASSQDYEPLVTVVIPSYNRLTSLRCCLKSIVSQSYNKFEVLVINDGGEAIDDVFGEFRELIDITCIQCSSNSGQSVSRNMGLKLAKGEIICFLDDDDVFLTHHLDTIVKGIEGSDFVYTLAEYLFIGMDGNLISKEVAYQGIEYSHEKILIENFIPINTWGVRKSILDTVGFFDESMTCLEDWELLIRLSSVCDFVQIPAVTVNVNMTENSESVTNLNSTNFADVFSNIYNMHGDLNSDFVRSGREKLLHILYKSGRGKVAVILHLDDFYLWNDINKSINNISYEFDIYISIPTHLKGIDDISNVILESYPGAKIYKTLNKGRDILPFLRIFKEVELLGYSFILKIHTNKINEYMLNSGRTGYANDFRKFILMSLVGGREGIDDILCLFESNPKLGIFSPVDYLYPVKTTDINYQMINELLIGIDNETFDINNYLSVANSMFWFRPEALKEILQLGLTDENFEEELDQLDGTLAHAIERLFGVVCMHSGYTLTDKVLKKDEVVYQDWLSYKNKLGLEHSNIFLQTVNKNLPIIHCLVYSDNEDLSSLANTIDSMEVQNYGNWHLSVVSCFPCPDELFHEVEQLSWLHIFEETNLNAILTSLNVGSEWVVFLEAGDMLEAHALSACVEYSLYYPDCKVIYTDEDILNSSGDYYAPNFKPDFNLYLLYSTDYIGGLVFFSLTESCEFGDVFFPSKLITYDLIFRYLELFSESAIAHKDSVLLHRLQEVEKIKHQQVELRAGLLADHFKRANIKATIDIENDKGNLFIRYIHNESPMVSIIIPTKDQLGILRACINSILEKTSYINYEVIIVDNQSSEIETMDYFESLKGNKLIKIIVYDDAYNYSAINNFAVSKSLGEYVVLLNNDTMVLQENWLQGMLNYAQCADVGVVGVKLVFPDKTLQHAGVILGMGENGVAEHPHFGISMNDAGYMGRAMCVQNMSAVTAACLMLKKSTYLDVGGLDEDKFKILYNDVDLCLKVKSLGRRNVWTPYVTLIHHGSASIKNLKVDEKKRTQTQYEIDSMVEKWLPQLANDPSYNRNLSLKTNDFQVDDTLNVTWETSCKSKPRVYAFPLDSSGVGQYRVRGPLAALTKNGIIESSLANNWDNLIYPTPAEIERIKPDVLLSQNAFLDHSLAPWKRYRRFNSTFMISGLDDLVYMLPVNHPKQGVWPKNIRRKVKELFHNSDRLIVANEALAEEFKKMASEVVVVPNYLEDFRWISLKIPTKQKNNKLRVGWAGGAEHIYDLQFIVPVVEALHKEVDWVFMGLCIDELKPFVKEIHGGVQFELYPQRLADLNLDLAIAPLMHNKFNECKTNLRLLEFGVMGWPIVCSDILPYQNAPVTRVANNTNEWVRVIREKINEPDELLKEGEMLRQWVVDNYMLDDHLDEWATALLPN